MKISLVKQSKFDAPIDRILEEMNEFGPGASEYNDRLGELERLVALQNTETWTRRLDPNQVAMAIANLAGIMTIVGYERMNVVTTKAIGMLLRKPNP